MIDGSLGYDATTLFVPPGVAGSMSFLSKLRQTGNDTVTGRSKYACRNLKIRKGRSKLTGNEMLTITGSLTSFLRDDNFKSLNFEEYKAALEKLSDELGINCGECLVWKAEFAGTVSTSDKPPLYFPCFQARPGLHANNMHSGVYLQYDSRALVIHIYDKSDDHHPNTLRLEVKRNKKVAGAIGRDYPVLASDLATPEIFNLFSRDWRKQVTSVLATPGELPELPEQVTPKTFDQFGAALARSYPKTCDKLKQTFESYDCAGLVSKNCRAKIRRELFGPHSEHENRRLNEIYTKIEVLVTK